MHGSIFVYLAHLSGNISLIWFLKDANLKLKEAFIKISSQSQSYLKQVVSHILEGLDVLIL